MKTSRFIALVALLSVLICSMSLCLTSCYQTPPTIIDPVDDPADSNTDGEAETLVTRPTIAVPDTQLTLADLIRLHDVEMPWSTLEPYAHDMTGDNAAHFAVADGYGAECSLDVTFDADSGLLTAATLTYGEVSESILTHSVQGISRIMLLMSEAE